MAANCRLLLSHWYPPGRVFKTKFASHTKTDSQKCLTNNSFLINKITFFFSDAKILWFYFRVTGMEKAGCFDNKDNVSLTLFRRRGERPIVFLEY